MLEHELHIADGAVSTATRLCRDQKNMTSDTDLFKVCKVLGRQLVLLGVTQNLLNEGVLEDILKLLISHLLVRLFLSGRHDEG